MKLSMQVGDGRYLLGPVLGRGGMATVYAAVDQTLQVLRAVKILDGPFLRSERARARFEREARTMARLEHPYILPVHDLLMQPHVCFQVTDLAWHGTLDQRLVRSGVLEPAQVVDLGLKLCSALAEAHRRDIVHRDVKPPNILIDEVGQPRLADWGVVRVPTTGAPMTRPGSTLGTAHYMAPEQQADSSSVDGRADLYALGRTLLRAATGVAGAEAHRALGRVPMPLAQVLADTLEPHRDRRPASAELLADALAASLPQLPPLSEGAVPLADRPLAEVRQALLRSMGSNLAAGPEWERALARVEGHELTDSTDMDF